MDLTKLKTNDESYQLFIDRNKFAVITRVGFLIIERGIFWNIYLSYIFV